MTPQAAHPVRKHLDAASSQSIRAKGISTARGRVAAHHSLIRALARKFTTSPEESTAAVIEIFNDIGRFGARGKQGWSAEGLLTSLMARRRLIKYLR